MFRTASRLPRRTAFLSASVAGTAVVLQEPREKLSIYPTPDPDVLLVDTPLVLEKEIGDVRKQVQGAYADAHAHVQGWVSKWIGVEHAFESRVKSIISPDEAITHGLLYSGVAGLAGSILARNRFLPTRIILPPVFLFAAANYFLPKTTGNLTSYLGDLEDKYIPVVAQKHDVAKAHSAMSWEMLKDATANGRAKLDEGAEVAVHKIQGVTGLKLKETLGWQRAKIQEAASRVQHEAQHVKEVASAKVEAAKEKVVAQVEKVEDKLAGETQKVAEKVEEKKEEEPKRLV